LSFVIALPVSRNGVMAHASEIVFPVRDYDLDATLASGQVFGWRRGEHAWTGVVNGRWVELSQHPSGVLARVIEPAQDWDWLKHFLQTDLDLPEVIATFPPDDKHLAAAVQACRGLRLLRQDPWECLASFILSSTKQIVQIRQIVQALSERHGRRVAACEGVTAYAFPAAGQLAAVTEAELRACKMGFRAPYLLAAARRVAGGEIDLAAVGSKSFPEAREELMKLAGVGEKIADCVLLFAYGFPTAFPVDVWVRRVLVQFYFRGRSVRPERLREFILKHFGVNAGYAQQYLFHQVRTMAGKKLSAARDKS
jgi:N-glycosylase/DNA lyase